MTQLVPPLYKKVAEGIWVGNETTAALGQLFIDNKITFIINLTGNDIDELFGDDPWYDCIDIQDFLLPGQELLATEMSKVTNKLDSIVTQIYSLRGQGKNIFIACVDGKNKSLLVAGYYLIVDQLKREAAGQPRTKSADDIVNELEMIYFTPAQRQEELDDRVKWDIDPDLIENNLRKLSADERFRLDQSRAERRAVRALTLSTFRGLLRAKK